ncbi:AFG1/ZapE family ATPase [Stutzerimonas stutzeri]|uniref:AFG1/ZapE family ATPase n=1 Tax=Stutzerimonas stutzeri TaxID=316 RepID=UPI0024B64E1A|nr:AFG1/ZapE family ATPase [Stutzerimonas stutzeri]MDI9730570.1 hypothetical protein [Stutzerimonas stutzeri]
MEVSSGGRGIDVQQRFLNLVDILYDHGNRLLLVSDMPSSALLSESAYVDFSRTRSRLQQLRLLPPGDAPTA